MVLTLRGRAVVLEPLELRRVDELLAAANESRTTYRIANVPADAASMEGFVRQALADEANGLAVPFVTIDAKANRVVGTTRFGNIERWSWPQPSPSGLDAVEIGWTWLAERAQRTAINTEAKYLMLRHAFEEWRVRRVTLKTDSRNERSRAAIERLGAKLDGVLRAHMPAFGGGIRDSAIYSILAAEWPAVRARLEARLPS